MHAHRVICIYYFWAYMWLCTRTTLLAKFLHVHIILGQQVILVGSGDPVSTLLYMAVAVLANTCL